MDSRHERIRRLPGMAELDEMTLAVYDLVGAARDLMVDAADAMGMNTTDMQAIHLLAEDGPMGTTALAARLGISQAATTVLVDRLERAGHLERVRDTVDRRRVVVSETAAARETSRGAWLPAIQRIDAVCRSLSEEDRAVALSLLDRLRSAMDPGAGS